MNVLQKKKRKFNQILYNRFELIFEQELIPCQECIFHSLSLPLYIQVSKISAILNAILSTTSWTGIYSLSRIFPCCCTNPFYESLISYTKLHWFIMGSYNNKKIFLTGNKCLFKKLLTKLYSIWLKFLILAYITVNSKNEKYILDRGLIPVQKLVETNCIVYDWISLFFLWYVQEYLHQTLED